MKRRLLAACAVVIGLSGASAGFAQLGPGPQCPPDAQDCARQQGNRPQEQGKRPPQQGQNHAQGPQQGPDGQRPRDGGRPDHARPDHARQNDRQGGPREGARQAPRVGDTGRQGRPFQQARDSRFPPPPRGQEYRVVRDHLVLVDKTTLAVVSVIGLLSALSN